MDLTSQEVAAIRFTGTRYVYNRREVDAFVRRVATTLRDQERELARIAARMAALEHALDVAHAARTSRAKASTERRRALDQAIRVAGAPRPPGSTPTAWEGLDTGAWDAWRETMGAEFASAAELDMAREEARRMRGCATALAVEIEGAAGAETVALLAAAEAAAEAASAESATEGSVAEATAADETEAAKADDDLAAAQAAAAEILNQAEQEAVLATEEAAEMLEKAEVAAQMLTAAAEQEAEALTRRLAQLRTAVRQAEDYYREIAPDAADEAAMAADLIDLELNGLDDVAAGEDRAGHVDVVVLDPGAVEAEGAVTMDDADGEPALVDGPREPDFYRRRLAGLRERLEKATTPE